MVETWWFKVHVSCVYGSQVRLDCLMFTRNAKAEGPGLPNGRFLAGTNMTTSISKRIAVGTKNAISIKKIKSIWPEKEHSKTKTPATKEPIAMAKPSGEQ